MHRAFTHGPDDSDAAIVGIRPFAPIRPGRTVNANPTIRLDSGGSMRRTRVAAELQHSRSHIHAGPISPYDGHKMAPIDLRIRARRFRWMLLAAVVATTSSGLAQTRPTCITASGRTDCGFSCVTTNDGPHCAQSPFGACAVNDGTAVCADPPAWAFTLGRRPASVRCMQQYDLVACGYDCVATDGQISCAQTEWGVCIAAYDHVQCWDPSPAVVFAYAARGGIPRAQCTANNGHLVCGYNCMSAYDSVACAQTPAGTCWARNGQLTCWDPT